MCYQDRIVSFVDILGFKRKIDNSLKDKKEEERILSSLKRILSIKTDNYREPNSLKDIGIEVSTFSDNAVISYEATSLESLLYILLDLVFLQFNLFSDGVLIRGGVTIGKLYHDRDIVYGPALNKAYYLESEIANYPRIVVDNELVSLYIEKYKDDRYELEELESLLKKDKDGCYYVDMLRQHQEINDVGNEYYDLLTNVRGIIVKGLSNKDLKIKCKYEWLKNYFNKVVTDDDAYYPVVGEDRKADMLEYRKLYDKLKI